MERTPWIERKFQFHLPLGWMANELERFCGTSCKLEALLPNINEDQASKQFDGKWSIKEHIGHLHELDTLHSQRIIEITLRNSVFTAADMSNAATEKADFNKIPKETLYSMFLEKRNLLINSIIALSDEDQKYAAFHERLKTKMRPIDIVSFASTHDEHHLVYIRALATKT